MLGVGPTGYTEGETATNSAGNPERCARLSVEQAKGKQQEKVLRNFIELWLSEKISITVLNFIC